MFRHTSRRKTPLAVTLLCVVTHSLIVQGVETTAEIRTHIEDRVKKFSTVDLTWKVKTQFTEVHGSTIRSDPFGDDRKASNVEGKFPATFEWQGHLQCAGSKLRLKFSRPSWIFDASEFQLISSDDFFDGTIGKHLRARAGRPFPHQGIIENRPIHAGDNDFSPFLWHFRAFVYPDVLCNRFFSPDVQVSNESLDGRTYVVMKLPKQTVWLDPLADYSVARLTTMINGQIRYDLRMNNERINGFVLPKRWTLEYYENGKLSTSNSTEIVKAVINEHIDDTVLSFDFPKATIVSDVRGDRERLVIIGAGQREFPITHQQTAKASSAEALLATVER